MDPDEFDYGEEPEEAPGWLKGLTFVGILLCLAVFVSGIMALLGMEDPMFVYLNLIVVSLLGIAYRLTLGYTD
jgi:hypothetical protein